MIWHVLSCNNTGLWLYTENKPQIKEISTQGYFKISLKKTQTHLRTQVTTHLCIHFNGSSHKRAHFFKKKKRFCLFVWYREFLEGRPPLIATLVTSVLSSQDHPSNQGEQQTKTSSAKTSPSHFCC